MDTAHFLKERRALDQHFDKCAVRCVVRRGKRLFPKKSESEAGIIRQNIKIS